MLFLVVDGEGVVGWYIHREKDGCKKGNDGEDWKRRK